MNVYSFKIVSFARFLHNFDMKHFFAIIFFGIFFCGFGQNPQSQYPQNYFTPPLKIPLYLAGNFGELRTNHFHAGIDIKTEGVVGKEVVASADGFVSRIKIQHGGYGKVIYIDHPNGYTTVYAHLQKFSKKIDEFVKKEQYHNKSFTINYYPDSGLIPIKKGELIALSGNTGGSGGPHLHFEIRDTKTEHPLNVLLFGMPIKDNIPPIIRGIKFYPLSENSHINESPAAQYFSVKKTNNTYELPTPIKVNGIFGVGIETIDQLNGSNNRCGVYSIQLKVDNEIIFEQEMEKVPFSESRYLNAHTDYETHVHSRKWIHKSFLEPNNQLSIYKTIINNGYIQFTDNKKHALQYIIKDVKGNTSKISFTVQSSLHENKTKQPIHANFQKKMAYHLDNEFTSKGFLINIPKGALYNDINFKYYQAPDPRGRWSNVHYTHTDLEPLHKDAEVIIKCNFPANVPSNKLLAIRKTSKGRVRTHVGKYLNGYYSFKTRYFGDFYIYHDTIPPVIKPLNIYNGKNISNQSKFDFKITDNLSGIKSYNCFIDGKWVLMEYDYKLARLTHYKHNVISSGKHTLKLIISDALNNTSVYTCTFVN